MRHLSIKNERYSSSCFINQYLESGDESALRLVYKNLKGTAFDNEDDYDFWIELRKYNINVPENMRIRVEGIDIEHQLDTACDYLNSILPEGAPPWEIRQAVQGYEDYCDSVYSANFSKAVRGLQKDINENQDIYSRYLGINYFDFSMVVDNIVNRIGAYAAGKTGFYKVREPLIYGNFVRIYYHLPRGKYFGQFGIDHVYQRSCSSSMGNIERFAMYLNSSGSPVKGRVLSIAYDYENCRFMNWANGYKEDKCDTAVTDFDILNKHSSKDITIFKLNGKNSPFDKKLYFIKAPDGGCTTDYFQYLILIKGSEGAEQLSVSF